MSFVWYEPYFLDFFRMSGPMNKHGFLPYLERGPGVNKGWEMLGVIVHQTLNSVEKNQPLWSLNRIYLKRD